MAAAHTISSPPETAETFDKFSDYLYVTAGFAPGTVNLTLGFVRRMAPAIGLDPSRDQVNRYLADMIRGGAEYANVSNAMKALSRYMAFLGRPMEFKPPRKPQAVGIVPLSEGKIAVMIFVAPTVRVRAMISTLAYTGIRNEELTLLRVRDLDATQQSLTVERGKFAKGRVCCVSADCLQILSEYLQQPRRYALDQDKRGGKSEVRLARPDDYLFVSVREGHRLETQDVRKWIRKVAALAKIDSRVWPHLMRHSFATNLMNRGALAHSIQALLGHADVSTTLNTYLHPSARNTRADYVRCMPSLV